MVKAVILGGHNKKSLQNKVLCPINDKPVIEYVVDALKLSQSISEIIIVGDVKKLAYLKNGKVTAILEERDSLAENVLAGVCSFQEHRVLIAAGDIPLLTKEAVENFVSNSLAAKADFCYAIVPEKEMVGKYPSKQKTYVRLKDGKFAGGNLFLVESARIHQMMDLGTKMLRYRKQPWQMCRLLGIMFLIKLLTGTLSIQELEYKINQLTGIKAKAILSLYPEIGNDIDKAEDFVDIRKHLTKNTFSKT